MRDWNRLFLAVKVQENHSFQHTYEGLKPILLSKSCRPSKVFSAYLWGIETLKKLTCSQTVVLFSAYLWGIETVKRLSLPSLSGWVFSIPMRDWNVPTANLTTYEGRSFQHTYEGLKHTSPPLLVSSSRSFQHTYEGLKPLPSIPTTRGNEQFSAYLWGIETPTHTAHYPAPPLFSAYLWGIET